MVYLSQASCKTRLQPTNASNLTHPANIGVLPTLYDFGLFKEPDRSPNAHGWARFSRVYGRPLSFDDLTLLSLSDRAIWVQCVVSEAIAIEHALEGVAPVTDWLQDYASVRMRRIENMVGRQNITNIDTSLFARIANVIERDTSFHRFLHGDLNPLNIITDLSQDICRRSTVRFVDPAISFDAPEANWRHLTLIPGLAESLSREYDRQVGYQTNHKLMYTIGAMTHLYMSLVEPDRAATRVEAAKRCLEVIQL